MQKSSRAHSTESQKRKEALLSTYTSQLSHYNFSNSEKFTLGRAGSEIKSGEVYIRNILPLKRYLVQLNSSDSYCKWVRVYLVLKSDLVIYMYPDKTREPFIDIKLEEKKFDLLPVKSDTDMSYFSLKVYKPNNQYDFIQIGSKTKEQNSSWFRSFVFFVNALKRQNWSHNFSHTVILDNKENFRNSRSDSFNVGLTWV